MPTKKQRRRDLKSKRHQYEFVYVDGEGNELDEPPAELVEREQRKERSTSKATASKQPAKKSSRREPQPPSWSRAAKRSLLLGVFFVILLAMTAKGHRIAVGAEGIVLAVVYMPLMYAMDRWMYRRYQAKLASTNGSAGGDRATRRPAKKH